MKLLSPFLALAATLALTSMAHANTALVLSSGNVTVSGSARAASKVTALAFYTPTYKFVDGKKTAACTFSEDELSMNDNDKTVSFTATQTGSGYTLGVPTTGIRGKCAYALDSISLYVTDRTQIYEIVQMKTSTSVDEENKILGSDGPIDAPDFKTVGALYCDYESTDTQILCNDKDGSLLSSQYEISSSPASYSFDVKDSSLMPAPQY